MPLAAVQSAFLSTASPQHLFPEHMHGIPVPVPPPVHESPTHSPLAFETPLGMQVVVRKGAAAKAVVPVPGSKGLALDLFSGTGSVGAQLKANDLL